MTPPIRPELAPAETLSRAGVRSLTPTQPAPTSATPAAPGQRTVSPYYFKYLNEQASQIRALADLNGENADTAIAQFLAMEQRKPFSMDPSAESLAARDPNVPSWLAGVPVSVFNGVTFGFGGEGLARLHGAITGVGARAGYEDYKRSYEAWGDKYGKTQVAGELLGGILPAFVGAAPVAQTGNWLRTAASAAGYGALAGAGHAEGNPDSFLRLDDRLRGALMGGAAGGVVGGTVGALGQFVAKPLVKAAADTPIGRRVGGAVEDAVRAVTQHDLVSVTPEARARELLVRRMIAAGVTYDDAERAMVSMMRDGVAPSLVAIGGDGVAELVGSATKQLSPRTAAVLEQLRTAMNDQPDALMGALSSMAPRRLGLAHAHDLIGMLDAEAAAKAAPFREHAFQQVVRTTPRIQKLFRKFPELRDAYQTEADQVAKDMVVGRGHGLPVPRLPELDAAKAAAKAAEPALRAEATAKAAAQALKAAEVKAANTISTEARAAADAAVAEARTRATAADLAARKARSALPPNPPSTLFPGELPVRGIDGMRQRLDAAVEASLPIPQGADKITVSKIMKLRERRAATLNDAYDEVVQEATKQVPSYGNALLAHAGPTKIRDAILTGERLWNKSPRAVEREMSKLPPMLQDFARVGYARKGHEVLSTRGTSNMNAAGRLFGGAEFGNRMRADQVRAMFPGNPAGADQFLRYALGQARIIDATSQVMQLARPSATQAVERAAEQSIPVRAGLGTSVLAAASNVAHRARTSLSQPEADEIAYLATKGVTNPEELRALLRELFFTYGGLAARPTIQRAGRRVLGEQVGGAIGR